MEEGTETPGSTSRTFIIGSRETCPIEVAVVQKFPSNYVKTSKYTALNFLPKNLFEQFRRVANLYFLCIAIIQLTIDSPVSPLTSSAPLVFVVSVTAIKQGYEDWLRHRSDMEVNERPASIVRNGKIKEVHSRDILVGDIVKVKANESFPCDLVLLSSENPLGECHITTANLDGETNLKIVLCPEETKNLNKTASFENFCAKLDCEKPTADLYNFAGRMTLYSAEGEKQVISLGPGNLLLRGASLKNTEWVYGCAVYTGQDTKLALNSKLNPNKFSSVERCMNTYLLVFILLLVAEIALCTGLHYYVTSTKTLANAWYLKEEDTYFSADNFVQIFLSFLVLFNYIIPISMYVTIELQKFLGSLFFTWDEDLYDPETDQCAKCNTSDLNEELGQVQYLFTDKTGTLTENHMLFRQCSISGKRYLEFCNKLCEMPDLHHVEPEPLTSYPSEVERFLFAVVLCHTVHVSNQASRTGDGSKTEQKDFSPDYQASSPDEKALVEACQRFGVVFEGFVDNNYKIRYRGKTHLYRKHHVLEFDSDRKCMSTIVSNQEGEYYLYTKGAESTVMPRCSTGPIQETLKHVNDYGMLGLRTLVFADRKLTKEEFDSFTHKLLQAKTVLVDRDNKVKRMHMFIEQKLTMLGATGLEDRLQDGVPETLECLRAAGIKVWILTGDKQETAINISYSCGQLKRSMIQLRLLQLKNTMQCHLLLEQFLNTVKAEPMQMYCLIVDGSSLTIALNNANVKLFRTLSLLCTTVVCCRMSPFQKAQVVKLIKNGPEKPITAAIGDGANDCSMIQEAHVGLGIMGKEGRQAVHCSDFAFARFKFLVKVLLVHGHFYYVRITTLVQYSFYKNFIFITPQFVYAFYSAFSAQTIYDSMLLALYNISFSSLPILVYGLMEQPVPQQVLLDNPQLYRNIARNSRLSPFQLFKWTVLAFWHAVVLFYGFTLTFSDVSLKNNGEMIGLSIFGTTIYQLCVILVNIKLAIETSYHTWLLFASFVFSIAGFVAFMCIYSGIDWRFLEMGYRMYWIYFKLASTPMVWLCLLPIIVVAFTPDVIFRVISRFTEGLGKTVIKDLTSPSLSESETIDEHSPLLPKF